MRQLGVAAGPSQFPLTVVPVAGTVEGADSQIRGQAVCKMKEVNR